MSIDIKLKPKDLYLNWNENKNQNRALHLSPNIAGWTVVAHGESKAGDSNRLQDRYLGLWYLTTKQDEEEDIWKNMIRYEASYSN